jgi:hypothetical protein
VFEDRFDNGEELFVFVLFVFDCETDDAILVGAKELSETTKKGFSGGGEDGGKEDLLDESFLGSVDEVEGLDFEDGGGIFVEAAEHIFSKV